MSALGDDNVYVRSDNPTGGTAYAAFEAFSVRELEGLNPVLIITMGDRIVTASVFNKLYETHRLGPREADLTLLTAIYEPPKNRGKGRLVRDASRKVVRIVEQRDIDAIGDSAVRQSLLDVTEGNCPLYAIRARTLRRYLKDLTNANAQGQYYITDIVEGVSRDGGDIRTITTKAEDPEYDLLCSDVSRPMDLALLEGVLASSKVFLTSSAARIAEAAQAILADRPAGQVAERR
jgi:bifunctional UDP-N-acetylglucosamine pyrophosphorylase/glucosamine-1-phosphate N-acetyltransferase